LEIEEEIEEENEEEEEDKMVSGTPSFRTRFFQPGRAYKVRVEGM
jgi:hypothetical protein